MAKVSEATKKNVSLALFDYNILSFGKFTLKSGVVSPYYIDLRMLQSHPKAFHAVVDIYAELIADLDENVFLAGIPEAGIPLATAIGYATERPLIQPRAKIKQHGKGKLVEGDWKAGDKVAIIDDLVAKGDSKIEALDQFKQAELNVVGFYLLIDREMGGRKVMEDAGYSAEIAMNISEIFEILHAENRITGQQKAEMLEFTKKNSSS
ncbi:MAG TPA: phosphoribosyltransferase family protein [Candidatus Saccharimonadales bacterium]|nr:phosphoribosyltransferase family protein [Candidatus Saccharimonadales bacterium]